MSSTVIRTAVLALGAVLAWSAVALAQADSAPAAAPTAELEAIYQARQDSARMRYTEVDVRFMSEMIHHHAQAIVMSRLAPTHGASPSIQTLAARIINAQNHEIATMQRWLEDRGQRVPETGIEEGTLAVHGADHGAEEAPDQPMAGHADHMAGHEHMAGHAECMKGHVERMAGHDEHMKVCAEHMKHDPMMDDSGHAADSTGVADSGHGPHLMPGMLTPEQMQELERAQGAEFDRLFLTYMIQHHQGAVTMVDQLFAADGAAQDKATFKLASDVQVDQRTEIARMERMLAAMSATGGAQANPDGAQSDTGGAR